MAINEFSKDLLEGIEAEFITKMFLETNLNWVGKQLGVVECLDVYWTDPETDTGDLHLDQVICEEDNVLTSAKCEVKAANKQPYWDTFYAEFRSLGSNGYSHYLVDKPKHIVYVDLIGKKLYWYDGLEFVDRVKKRRHSCKTNRFGTAEGLTFGIDDLDFGFRFSADVKQMFHYVRKNCYEEIKERCDKVQAQTNKVPVHKVCEGLPDLY